MSTFHRQLQQQAMQLSQLSGEPVRAFSTDFAGLVEINRQLGIIAENGLGAGGGAVAWNDVQDKPEEFPTSWELVANPPSIYYPTISAQPIQHLAMASNAVATGTIQLANVAFAVRLTTDKDIWFRLYRTEAFRTLDENRAIDTDPSAQQARGLLFEVIAKPSEGNSVNALEEMLVYSTSQPSATFYYSLQNLEASSQDVNLSLEYIPFIGGGIS